MLAVFHQLLGGVLVIVGIILTPTPIPFGLIMLTVGLALLAPYLRPVQSLVRTIRRRWPNVDLSLRRHRHRFSPIIQSTIDKTHPDIVAAE